MVADQVKSVGQRNVQGDASAARDIPVAASTRWLSPHRCPENPHSRQCTTWNRILSAPCRVTNGPKTLSCSSDAAVTSRESITCATPSSSFVPVTVQSQCFCPEPSPAFPCRIRHQDRRYPAYSIISTSLKHSRRFTAPGLCHGLAHDIPRMCTSRAVRRSATGHVGLRHGVQPYGHHAPAAPRPRFNTLNPFNARSRFNYPSPWLDG